MDPGFGIMVSKWAERKPPPAWLVPSLAIVAIGACIKGIQAGNQEPPPAAEFSPHADQVDLDPCDISGAVLTPIEK